MIIQKPSDSMVCAACQRLEAELNRLKRIHSDAARAREANWHHVRGMEHRRLRGTENDAWLAVEYARAALDQHKRSEHRRE